jgi:hypothetical protein
VRKTASILLLTVLGVGVATAGCYGDVSSSTHDPANNQSHPRVVRRDAGPADAGLGNAQEHGNGGAVSGCELQNPIQRVNGLPLMCGTATSGKCLSRGDCALALGDFPQVEADCELRCLQSPDCPAQETCLIDCLADASTRLTDAAVSRECASCIVDYGVCQQTHCSAECAVSGRSCDLCATSMGCFSTYMECTGLMPCLLC